MSARNIPRDACLQQLRAAYEEAFNEWAFSITRLQMLTRASAGSESIREAQNRVTAAYMAYRETRDLLAANLRSKWAVGSRTASEGIRTAPAVTNMPDANQLY